MSEVPGCLSVRSVNSSVIMEEGRPILPSWSRQANLPHVLLDRSFAHANIQFEQLASNALSSPEPIVLNHILEQCDRLWRDLRLS